MRHKSVLISLIFILVTSCKTINLTEIEKRYVLKESSKDRYYLIKLIREKRKGGLLGESPALFIDNDFVADSFKKTEDVKIKKSDIHSIEILDSEKSVKIYGARGKHGFIRVWTSGWKKPLP